MKKALTTLIALLTLAALPVQAEKADAQQNLVIRSESQSYDGTNKITKIGRAHV